MSEQASGDTPSTDGQPTDEQPKTDEPEKSADDRARSRDRLRSAGSTVKKGTDALRNRIASVIWIVAVLCAVVLALGALLISLDANTDNSLVDLVIRTARRLDGPFGSVFTFDGDNAKTKARLVNWGLAALAYLIVGRVLERVVRP